MSGTELSKTFDYTSIDAEHRQFAEQAASDIRGLLRRSAADIWNIGKSLSEVKEKLGHGKFLGWLDAEFNMSERSAYNFTQVFDQFELATVANLDVAARVLYALASPSTPEEVREEAVVRAGRGEKITGEQIRSEFGNNLPTPPGEKCVIGDQTFYALDAPKKKVKPAPPIVEAEVEPDDDEPIDAETFEELAASIDDDDEEKEYSFDPAAVDLEVYKALHYAAWRIAEVLRNGEPTDGVLAMLEIALEECE